LIRAVSVPNGAIELEVAQPRRKPVILVGSNAKVIMVAS
jgi:hypothetical protein